MRKFAAFAFVLALAGCGSDNDNPFNTSPVASIDISSPVGDTIWVGDAIKPLVVPLDASGNPITGGRLMTFVSSDPTVVEVLNETSGTSTAVGPGDATINVTVDGVTQGLDITVLNPIVEIDASAGSETLIVGQTTTIEAATLNQIGDVLDGPITFISDDPSVVTVTQAGVVTAVGPGTATVTLTNETDIDVLGEAVEATITFTVIPYSLTVNPTTLELTVGGTAQLSTVLRNAGGGTVSAPVTYTSLNPLVATVSSTGVVTAVAPGEGGISVSSGGVEQIVPVVVIEP